MRRVCPGEGLKQTEVGGSCLIRRFIISTPYLIYNTQVNEDKISGTWVRVEEKKNAYKVFTSELEGKGTQKTSK